MWDVRQNVAARATESKLAVGLSVDLGAFFVNRAVVTATQQREIRKRRGASIGPVTDVVALTESNSAAGKAAAAVSVVECPPYCRWNRAGPRRDLDDAAVPIVLHTNPAGVTRDAPGRFNRNARAVLEEGLALLIGIGEGRRIDVDDDLVSLARCAGIDAVMERRLREQRQSVGPLLGHRRRFRGAVHVL